MLLYLYLPPRRYPSGSTPQLARKEMSTVPSKGIGANKVVDCQRPLRERDDVKLSLRVET